MQQSQFSSYKNLASPRAVGLATNVCSPKESTLALNPEEAPLPVDDAKISFIPSALQKRRLTRESQAA